MTQRRQSDSRPRRAVLRGGLACYSVHGIKADVLFDVVNPDSLWQSAEEFPANVKTGACRELFIG